MIFKRSWYSWIWRRFALKNLAKNSEDEIKNLNKKINHLKVYKKENLEEWINKYRREDKWIAKKKRKKSDGLSVIFQDKYEIYEHFHYLDLILFQFYRYNFKLFLNYNFLIL